MARPRMRLQTTASDKRQSSEENPKPQVAGSIPVPPANAPAPNIPGLAARLYTKVTAHTLCVWINRLLGGTDVLHLKALAFPLN